MVLRTCRASGQIFSTDDIMDREILRLQEQSNSMHSLYVWLYLLYECSVKQNENEKIQKKNLLHRNNA